MIDAPKTPCSLVVMGVSGIGKSLIGRKVADALRLNFVDADDLHSEQAKAKMESGQALTDQDRAPWLDRVGLAIGQSDDLCVMACSALKRDYRDRIAKAANVPVIWVFPSVEKEVIARRLEQREGHFMPTSLLDSQFATLEGLMPDEPSVIVDGSVAPDEVVSQILVRLQDVKV